MAVVPEPNTTDEQQPAFKKHHGFFSVLIDALIHDITPSGLRGEIDHYLATPCLPEEE